MTKIIIIGGGAAGFFAAITIAEVNPKAEVIILEKGKNVLQKVKISGGGRCNVTHACFDPRELVEFYPRGKRELLGPFHKFMTGDTMEWFENRGVPLKIEEDNRIFPESNSSQTIIDCFTSSAEKAGVKLLLNQNVNSVVKKDNQFEIKTSEETFIADKLLIAAGSNPKMWELAKSLDHSIIEPVPSLFTFNIEDNRLKDIPGTSVPNATVKLLGTKLESSGPLLITHWGLSGPAVLKLSAFGARLLAEKNYIYKVEVNWLSKTTEEVLQELKSLKESQPKKQVIVKSPLTDISKRLWEKLVLASDIRFDARWADLSNKQLHYLANQLTKSEFSANGKSVFKDEFVTSGGINLKEIDFKRFESKLHKNLFFAGEVLDIDAVTGGFNFQNAWTGGFISGNAMAEK
ncbi:MAG: aminoacetone oxidase family FAD-binding enzyme [Flavobacteriaceae bacterium]|nr:MAG: aminoacetone oxidase family FAD-binding enzyme [Flavobacteriaceae bacterium]